MREDSNAVFRTRKSQGAEMRRDQGNDEFPPQNVFCPLFKGLMCPWFFPNMHVGEQEQTPDFQDITVLSSYNATAALLGQVPPGRTRCLKNKAVFLEQHIMAPNLTGVSGRSAVTGKPCWIQNGLLFLSPCSPKKPIPCFMGPTPALIRTGAFSKRAGGRWVSCPCPFAG